MKKFIKQKKGFTLVELLIVVAIISLLASIILVSINTARAKSRDAKRLADLHQIQIALDLYFNVNGSYPKASVPCDVGDWGADSWATLSTNFTCSAMWNELQTNLSPYISKLPTDPAPQNGDSYYYGVFKGGKGYMLLAWPEVSKLRGNTCVDYYDGPGGTSNPNQGYYCLGESFQ